MNSYSLLIGIFSMCLLVSSEPLSQSQSQGEVILHSDSDIDATPNTNYYPVEHIRKFFAAFDISKIPPYSKQTKYQFFISLSSDYPKFKKVFIMRPENSDKVVISSDLCYKSEFRAVFNVVTGSNDETAMKNIEFKLCRKSKSGKEIRDELAQTPDLANLRALKDSCAGKTPCTLKLTVFGEPQADINLTGDVSTSSKAPTPTISNTPTPTISKAPTPTISKAPTPTISNAPTPTTSDAPTPTSANPLGDAEKSNSTIVTPRPTSSANGVFNPMYLLLVVTLGAPFLY